MNNSCIGTCSGPTYTFNHSDDLGIYNDSSLLILPPTCQVCSQFIVCKDKDKCFNELFGALVEVLLINKDLIEFHIMPFLVSQ